MGTTAVITGPMIASGRSYMDIEAEVAEAALRLIIQAEEWADFNASSSVNSLAYNGLIASLVTNVTDNAGAALTASGVTIPAFDKMIKKVRLQGGNKLDAIYLSFGLQAVVNQIVSPQTHYYINIDNPAGTMQAGDHVVSYASPIGSVPVIGDFFCNAALPYPASNAAGSSGAQGLPFSDVFFLRHDPQGLEMADLVPVGRTELAKIADTVNLAVLKQGYIGETPEMDNPDGREYLNRWQTPANDYTPCSPIRCS